ncbi:MAG: lactate racemase domain-containing protein [Chthonomonadales bacterium]
MQILIDPMAFAFPEILMPPVWRVVQRRATPELTDVAAAAREAAARLCRDPRIAPGASVAVGVGSRGIWRLPEIVAAVIAELKAHGAHPFIVPAMGSHGGATADGQRRVLESYGITAQAVGAQIRATMEVVQVATLEDGYPVYFDRYALEADAVVVINRIKPHTDYHGPIESGPSKMCAIGLGKLQGALTIHRYGATGLREIIPRVARKIVEACPVVGGVAILENAYGRTAEIHALPAADMAGEAESRLLERARQLMPALPFQQIDVLVVDEMGKDISGAGMDTNVIGRVEMPSIPESEWNGPCVRCICVLDLTEASHGNAAGLGLADFTTRRLIEKCDFAATFTNSRTSHEGGVRRLKLPIILENAQECVRAAIATCGRGRAEEVRMVRVRNTERLELMEVSEPLLAEVRSRPDLQIAAGPLRFDPDTALPTP